MSNSSNIEEFVAIECPSGILDELGYVSEIIFKRLGVKFRVDITESDNIKLSFREKQLSFSSQLLHDLSKTSSWDRVKEKIEAQLKNLGAFQEHNTGDIERIDVFALLFLAFSQCFDEQISQRDEHGRAIESQHPLILDDIRLIPIVDLIIGAIKVRLQLPDTQSSYTPTLTIDVDELYKWKEAKDFPIWAWNHLKKGKPSRIFHDLLSLSKTLLNRKKDPYNNLEEMISLAIAKNIDLILFLKLPAKKVDKYDRSIYRPKNLVDALESKFSGKITYGLHPQYKHYTQAEELKKEKEQLETALGFEIKHIRQHFLRFKSPDTWQAQLKAGFKLDSTLGFSQKGGFKCGTCHPFPIYDAERKQAAELWEQPLLLMETPYLNRNAGKQLLSDLEQLTSEVKKYRGNNTILWHNSSFVYPEDRALFKKAIEIISSEESAQEWHEFS